jgi:hypothetical protein
MTPNIQPRYINGTRRDVLRPESIEDECMARVYIVELPVSKHS